MKLVGKALLWWHRRKTRAKMQRVFSRGEDPFHYDSGSPYETERLAAMEKALGARAYKDVLEIGCAEGAFTERLAKAATKLTALDISAVALSRARKRLPQVSFVETDIRDWSPAKDQRYDLIVLGDVLYYLDKPLVRAAFEETFTRVASWLAPGGRLVLAHGFAGPEELKHRTSFRERFEKQGLKLVCETVAGPETNTVRCLISSLLK